MCFDWEHDILLPIGEGKLEHMKILLMESADKVKQIFAAYGLELKGDDSELDHFFEELKKVITHGKKNVGVHIPNSIRSIP